MFTKRSDTNSRLFWLGKGSSKTHTVKDVLSYRVSISIQCRRMVLDIKGLFITGNNTFSHIHDNNVCPQSAQADYECVTTVCVSLCYVSLFPFLSSSAPGVLHLIAKWGPLGLGSRSLKAPVPASEGRGFLNWDCWSCCLSGFCIFTLYFWYS